MNFYNEFDPNAAAWLRELIAWKLIPAGIVDERSITEIQPHELSDFTQCHFFAGIGGWPLALDLAGWDSTRPVWTGSCPCQPFSPAGKGLAKKDPRHLWPDFFRLIRECRPNTVFGEQVESAIGHGWLDDISADLEGEGYACGASVLGAHSVCADHRRQRLYWVADTGCQRLSGINEQERQTNEGRTEDELRRASSGLADSERPRLQGHGGDVGDGNQPGRIDPDSPGSTAACGATGGGLGNTQSGGLGVVGDAAQPGSSGHADSAGVTHWSDSRWIYCRDGKHRRIPQISQPVFLDVVNGFSATVDAGGTCRELQTCFANPEALREAAKGSPLVSADAFLMDVPRKRSARPPLLKGYGNAIVPEVAAGFIQVFTESI